MTTFAIPSVNLPVVQGRIQNKLLSAAIASLRFRLNKLQHGAAQAHVAPPNPLINTVGGLTFYTAQDESGIMRGGNLPWHFLPDLTNSSILSSTQQCSSVRAILAQLPGNVAFTFSTHNHWKDLTRLAEAFTKSGFIHSTRHTYVYRAPYAEINVLSQMRADARNKVNCAIRDLEITSMSADAYFDFYKKNLAAQSKACNFNLKIDEALVCEALKSDLVQIIATRRKSVGENEAPAPIEAAIILTTGADGYMKLLRITYVVENQILGLTPHKHAIKLLVHEALCRAARNGLALDTDGYTPGGHTLYSRFGIFMPETRHFFERKTLPTLLNKFIPAFLR